MDVQAAFASPDVGTGPSFSGLDLQNPNVRIGADEMNAPFTTFKPLSDTDNSLSFLQGSFSNHDSDRKTLNLGFGQRILSDDKNFMYGLNIFYDRELDHEHQRGSIGAEIKSSILELNTNHYFGISNELTGKNSVKEEVADGYDLEIGAHVPYMPTAKIYTKLFEYDIPGGSDFEGIEYASKIGIPSEILFPISLCLGISVGSQTQCFSSANVITAALLPWVIIWGLSLATLLKEESHQTQISKLLLNTTFFYLVLGFFSWIKLSSMITAISLGTFPILLVLVSFLNKRTINKKGILIILASLLGVTLAILYLNIRSKTKSDSKESEENEIPHFEGHVKMSAENTISLPPPQDNGISPDLIDGQISFRHHEMDHMIAEGYSTADEVEEDGPDVRFTNIK